MGGCSTMNLDDNFPIRQALPVGLSFAAGLGFPEEIICYSRYNISK